MALTSGLTTLLDTYSVPQIIAAGVVLIVAYIVGSGIYNVYFHPLAQYPGPRLAALTRAYWCYYCLRGTIIYALNDWHQQYGDVIRIAPDELAYCTPEAWNDIYGHRQGLPELQKDPNFISSQSSGAGSVINTTRERHGPLRKQMSHGFSEKALRSQEHVIRKYADLLIQRLGENIDAGKPTVTLVSWLNFFTFDVMGDLVFGESFSCLVNSGYHPWVRLIFDSVKLGMFNRCSKYFTVPSSLVGLLIPRELKQRRIEQRTIAKAKAQQRRAIDDGRHDLVSGMLKENSDVSPKEYQSTVETLIIAGSETTATLLSGVIYYLLMDPEKMETLVKEIRHGFKSAEEIDFVSVNGMPYLLACLQEALRMYPPVPDGFPRNTGDREETICERQVPPHTVVRVTHWPTYRSPKNFFRPDEFVPERWMNDNPDFANDRKEALQPFNVGPRNCLGRNLAYFEMRLMLTILLWHYDLELDPRSRNWIDQKAYLLWEKPEMYVKVSRRKEKELVEV